MTKNTKKLQLAVEELKKLEGLNLPAENLHMFAVEVDVCIKAVKDSYSWMESVKEILLQKFILVNRAGKAED